MGKIEEFKHQVLDAYFLMRYNMPKDGAVQQNRTTLSIQEDLEPMIRLSGEDIINYMMDHDFSTTTEPDGTVTWAIWRTF